MHIVQVHNYLRLGIVKNKSRLFAVKLYAMVYLPLILYKLAILTFFSKSLYSVTIDLINLTKLKIAWEKNLNGMLSTLGWHCGHVCGVGVLIKLVKLIQSWNTKHTMSSIIP